MAEQRASTVITVIVVYGHPDQQNVHSLKVPADCTAMDAIHRAGCAALWQDGQGGHHALACFGRRIDPDIALVDGDRVEILRPLTADPKDQRRARANAVRRASARNKIKAR